MYTRTMGLLCGMQLDLADVSFRVRFGAQMKSLRTFTVNLYRRTPHHLVRRLKVNKQTNTAPPSYRAPR